MSRGEQEDSTRCQGEKYNLCFQRRRILAGSYSSKYKTCFVVCDYIKLAGNSENLLLGLAIRFWNCIFFFFLGVSSLWRNFWGQNASDVGCMRRTRLIQMMCLMNGSFVLVILQIMMGNIFEKQRRNSMLLFCVPSASLEELVSLLLFEFSKFSSRSLYWIYICMWYSIHCFNFKTMIYFVQIIIIDVFLSVCKF